MIRNPGKSCNFPGRGRMQYINMRCCHRLYTVVHHTLLEMSRVQPATITMACAMCDGQGAAQFCCEFCGLPYCGTACQQQDWLESGHAAFCANIRSHMDDLYRLQSDTLVRATVAGGRLVISTEPGHGGDTLNVLAYGRTLDEDVVDDSPGLDKLFTSEATLITGLFKSTKIARAYGLYSAHGEQDIIARVLANPDSEELAENVRRTLGGKNFIQNLLPTSKDIPKIAKYNKDLVTTKSPQKLFESVFGPFEKHVAGAFTEYDKLLSEIDKLFGVRIKSNPKTVVPTGLGVIDTSRSGASAMVVFVHPTSWGKEDNADLISVAWVGDFHAIIYENSGPKLKFESIFETGGTTVTKFHADLFAVLEQSGRWEKFEKYLVAYKQASDSLKVEVVRNINSELPELISLKTTEPDMSTQMTALEDVIRIKNSGAAVSPAIANVSKETITLPIKGIGSRLTRSFGDFAFKRKFTGANVIGKLDVNEGAVTATPIIRHLTLRDDTSYWVFTMNGKTQGYFDEYMRSDAGVNEFAGFPAQTTPPTVLSLLRSRIREASAKSGDSVVGSEMAWFSMRILKLVKLGGD